MHAPILSNARTLSTGMGNSVLSNARTLSTGMGNIVLSNAKYELHAPMLEQRSQDLD